MDWADDDIFDEHRWKRIGRASAGILLVVYVERFYDSAENPLIRIIPPEGPLAMSDSDIFHRRDELGRLFRIETDGREVLVVPPSVRPMTDEDVLRATQDDQDAQPLDFERLKLVPRVRSLRRSLGLTQEMFSSRYHIPLGTLRDWEQGRSVPDAPAKAYLEVIAAEPDMVARAFRRVA